ncbi:hypothetical protein SASPL_133425 [Salvia splendens]|uniref:non-specific serine/threonine protein kinase n=1 Tax=Salvia splendens TaxID=180675 RepID=A0A8X8X2P3_SALSN|nr:hypothetical protein SASPL_133425 [Salvia splendens]
MWRTLYRVSLLMNSTRRRQPWELVEKPRRLMREGGDDVDLIVEVVGRGLLDSEKAAGAEYDLVDSAEELGVGESILHESESNSELYWKCSNTFSCGANITGIGYPFRGSTDPDYCGHRSLVLRCDERSNATTMEMAGLTYRVLEMDQETLRIAREETMSSACPAVMANTTLDYSVFDYAATCMNYTFFYDCRFDVDPEAVHMTRVACGGDGGDAYVAPWVVPPPPVGVCGASVVVSGALMAVDKPLDAKELGEALKHGFQIRWKMESQSCGECRASGGRCGYDLAANKTLCYCPHPPYISHACATSSPPTSKGNTNTARTIGLFIGGAVLAGVGLGWLAFHCRQKRKQMLSSRTATKEVTSSPSTKGLLSSNSIPSYPSPKSDFGRGSSYFGVQVFSCTELEEATNKFDPSRQLGDGGFGLLSDGRVVAVKRLYENNYKRTEQFINEVEILARLRHQYLVTLYGCTSRRSQELLLVYEYVPNGTVADHLHGKRAKSGLLSWPIRQRQDINLSNMAVNKIQNHTLHELVDSSLGFNKNSSARRMVTLVSELAFRCLQQEKDMRPSMQEVLDSLKGVQNEDSNAHKVEIVNLFMDDDAGLHKGGTTPKSQDSLP